MELKLAVPFPALLPAAPYYAVIFSSVRTAKDAEGYSAAAARMEALARGQPGFLGIESARGPDGAGITVSYWASEEAIAGWRKHVEHQAAQAQGRDAWYARYEVRICRVERAYGVTAERGSGGAS